MPLTKTESKITVKGGKKLLSDACRMSYVVLIEAAMILTISCVSLICAMVVHMLPDVSL